MKKLFLIVVGAILIMFFNSSFAISGSHNSPCKEPLIKHSTLQGIVDQWFIDKQKTHPQALRMITAKSIIQSNQKGKFDDVLSAALQETILYEDYTDAINCAITVDEAKKLQKERDTLRFAGGNVSRDSLRQFPKTFKDETRRKKAEQLINCYFADTEPTLRKMYLNHPSRENCSNKCTRGNCR